MAVGEFGYCCTDCQIYWTCETKWYRGEKHEENICCTTCNYYNKCQKIWKDRTRSLKKKQN